MKLLKYMSLALLATAVAGCSEDGPDPNAIDPGSFFPSYGDVAYQKCAPNPDEGVFDNIFNVQICRTSNEVGQKVRLAYSVKVYDAVSDAYVEGSKGLFTVPEEYTYTTSEPVGYIPVTAHNELMEIHEPILLTITILDDTSFGANTIEITYQRVNADESWTPVATCNVVDGWIFPIFGMSGYDYSFDCSFDVNDADPQLFRLVSPYQSSSFFEVLRSYNVAPAGGRYYWQIDLNDFDVPCVLPSVAGWEFRPDVIPDQGMLSIANTEGYYLVQGYTYDEIAEGMDPEERSTYKDRVLNINTCLLFNESDQLISSGGTAQVIFPPHIEILEDQDATAKVNAMPQGAINREIATKNFAKKLRIKL